MFGSGGFKIGSVMTVALSVGLLLVRIFLVRHYYAQGVPQHLGFLAAQPGTAPAPASSWLMFATTDRDTQIRTRHARLSAEVLPSASAPATDVLELRAVGRAEGDALVTLASVPADKCMAIDHVEAVFDSRAKEIFAVAPTLVDAVCSVKLDGFDRFVQGLLNAQTLVLTPQAGSAALRHVEFHVAGLTWDPE